MIKQKVIVAGGDGFCGWPTALRFSSEGWDVLIIDNLSRRKIDRDLGTDSLTPIKTLDKRVETWRAISGNVITVSNIDLGSDYAQLCELLIKFEPTVFVHFAEQRSAPYSMKNQDTNRYTVENNIAVTNNICLGIAKYSPDTHLVHLGTMGVYGYGSSEFPIPEGYQKVKFINSDESESSAKEILYPTDPGSIYHMTKSLDQILFQFYVKNYGIRVTDLHQGIVWGTQTTETRLHEVLVNRFDYDGDYGTVLNRFLVEAAIGYPLTVHGSGGQTRAFINIEDSVTCVYLASTKISQSHDNSRVCIMNQTAETATVIDLANLVLRKTGGTLQLVDNPRKEADSNNLNAFNQLLQNLGWRPIYLESHLLDEVIEMVEKHKTRVFVEKIPATSRW